MLRAVAQTSSTTPNAGTAGNSASGLIELATGASTTVGGTSGLLNFVTGTTGTNDNAGGTSGYINMQTGGSTGGAGGTDSWTRERT